MASLTNVESIVNYIASGLSTTVKTKFTNNDSGYAAANGSFENQTRFNVLEVDETGTDVVQLTVSSGTSLELTINKVTSNRNIADKMVAALKSVS